NAIGDARPLEAVLAGLRAAAAHTGDVVTADDAWLEAQGVSHWAGDRSLPLWLPTDMTGFMTRSNAAYRAAGGALSPLEGTIARVLDDERTRGLLRPRRAGLTREDELALLARLA